MDFLKKSESIDQILFDTRWYIGKGHSLALCLFQMLLFNAMKDEDLLQQLGNQG